MRMTYTQRLMLSVGSYAFVLMLFSSLLVWAVIESTESDETEKLALYLDHAFAVALASPAAQSQGTQNQRQAPSSTTSPIKTPYFTLYLPDGPIPSAFQAIKTPGYSILGNQQRLLVGIHPVSSKHYYVAFDEPQLEETFEAEFDDIMLIITLAIIATGLAMAITWQLVKRLAAPVIQLKQQVDQIDAHSQDLPLLQRDDEVGQLSEAFGALIKRMRHFAQREQDFTRFASHELRSPVTVMQGNLDLLRGILTETALNQRVLARMDSAIRRMTLLIEAFLWLGREQDAEQQDLTNQTIGRKEVESQIEESLLFENATNRQRCHIEVEEIEWQLKPALLSILLDNLIRNAQQHSGGTISDQDKINILAAQNSLRVTNPVSNIDEQQRSGIGLQIVTRICQKNRWILDIQENEESFNVTIHFNTAD